MSTIQLLFIAVAGVGAGALNAALGGGMLILYPALLTAGLPPVPANATSTIGVIPGSVSGAWQYRREFADRQRNRVIGWLVVTAAGAAIGAALVVLLPSAVFDLVIPWLIVAACVLFGLQPLLNKLMTRWRHPALVPPALGLVGVYGGYFGAAQGIAYLVTLTCLDGPDIHRANAVKNLLVAAANGAAGVIFILAGQVQWVPALVAAVGAALGGLAGGRLARTLPPWLLRTLVIVVGLYGAFIALFWV